jgi:hypothetical protein
MLHTGEVLATTAFKHCDNEPFREKMGLPNDTHSRIALKGLHLWMLQQRINEDMRPEANDVIHRLYDLLWDDLETVMHNEGYLLLHKHKQYVQSAVYGGLVTYDKTLQIAAGPDSDYRPYLAALWRNLYGSDPKLDRNRLVQMREYIVEQRMHIRGISDNDFYDGVVSFGEPGPLVHSEEAETLDPEASLKPLFEPGSDELKYNFSRSPLKNLKFEDQT